MVEPELEGVGMDFQLIKHLNLIGVALLALGTYGILNATTSNHHGHCLKV